MENVASHTLPKKYHDAVVRWAETFLPDYRLLVDNWERFFPRDPPFRLCAYRQGGMCGSQTCNGYPKGGTRNISQTELMTQCYWVNNRLQTTHHL